MNTSETAALLKKVRKIEIKTRGLSNALFAGEYHSAFKGSGMSFSEVRNYAAGDEIRKIDWNVTARFNHPFVKVFEEERELTVILLVDVSKSEMFGTRVQLKRDLIAEVCAVLSFSAIQNNDKVGVIFFSSEVEMFIPPKKGKSHILRIIRELLTFQPQKSGTDIEQALRFFTNAVKKKCTAFIISDFLDYKNYSEALRIANRKHDLIALRTLDPSMYTIPNLGFVRIADPETGMFKWVNTASRRVREKYAAHALAFNEQWRENLKRAAVDEATLQTDKPFIQPLHVLFKKRGGRR
jgi:uncharacterized protein (DUF58 family)